MGQATTPALPRQSATARLRGTGPSSSGTARCARFAAAELATARMIKIDVEGGEDRVLAGMLEFVDALAADAELVIRTVRRFGGAIRRWS